MFIAGIYFTLAIFGFCVGRLQTNVSKGFKLCSVLLQMHFFLGFSFFRLPCFEAGFTFTAVYLIGKS